MRVLLNLHSTLGPLTGIGHYTLQLLRCLREQAPESVRGSFPLVLGKLYGKFAGLCGSKEPRFNSARPALRTRLGWFLARKARGLTHRTVLGCQRAIAWTGRFDVYHEPNFVPRPSSIPAVSTIHDLSVLLHPEWHPRERVLWLERGLPGMLRQCVHYLTVSDAVRQEIIRTLNIPPERVTRAYNGVRPWLRPMTPEEVAPVLRRLGLPPRYLLYLGTIEPRKNVLTLLRAYSDLPSSLREGCPLVLAGGWGWKAEEVAAFFHDEARHKGVLRLGYVPEEDVGALYNGARALVFPSLYEGFGLPPVEMLACGGAVLASTAEAVAEVAGGQAHLIEPHDVAGWREAMRRVVEEDAWHAQLCQGAVEHARPFTWDVCAADTLRVYRAVAANRHDGLPQDDKARAA